MADQLASLLSAHERARAEQLLSERRRQLWTRSRGVLRALLGRYLQRDPSTLRSATGTHGKLALKQVHLSFNLSHSGQFALYAFCRTGSVGVDLELARRPMDVLAVAARVLGNDEAGRLGGLDPTVRQREFLRAWARHEAECKWRGTGIGVARADVSAREPWTADLEVGLDAAAAVAVEHPPVALRCWDWRV